MPHSATPKVAFIFDCDGTLVNSTPVWAYAQPELLHRHGVDVTVDDFAQFEHLSLEDECQAYHDTWGIGANGEELYRELGEILIDGYSKVPPREGLLAFLEQAQEEQRAATAEDRKSQVGTGDRSERIRTYNYPQGRVTDHRIGLTLHKLDSIVNGDLDELLGALITAKQSEQLRQVK